MPYWLSLLADLLARGDQPDAARATLDAALVDGRARDELWWLPEVMRMRAAYDEEQAAIARLRSAAQMASAHGSVGPAQALRAMTWPGGAPGLVTAAFSPRPDPAADANAPRTRPLLLSA